MVFSDEEINRILEEVDEDLHEDAREVLETDYSASSDRIRAGLETEYQVVDVFEPSSSEARDEAIKDLDFVHKEVGAGLAEAVTDPINLYSLEDLRRQLESKEEDLVEDVSEKDLSLVRYGIHPFAEIGDVELSQGERYQKLVNRFDDLRDERPMFGVNEKMDPNGADIVGMIGSTHLNIQAKDIPDAIEKANYLNMIQPEVVAMSGNSRIVEGKDTGFSDPRIKLWEENYNAADNPNRKEQTGLVDPYLGDDVNVEDEDMAGIADYLSRMYSKFDSESLEAATGEYWKDVRIKFYDGNEEGHESGIVVEGRLPSVQPSVRDETGLHGYLIGRLVYAQENDEDLLPIEKLRENRENAIRDGPDAELWYFNDQGELEKQEAGSLIYKKVREAKEGLEIANIGDEGYLSRVVNRPNSEQRDFKRSLEQKGASYFGHDEYIERFGVINSDISEIREALPDHLVDEALEEALPFVNQNTDYDPQEVLSAIWSQDSIIGKTGSTGGFMHSNTFPEDENLERLQRKIDEGKGAAERLYLEHEDLGKIGLTINLDDNTGYIGVEKDGIYNDRRGQELANELNEHTDLGIGYIQGRNSENFIVDLSDHSYDEDSLVDDIIDAAEKYEGLKE
jgi:gamma-glutamyl:cysteine ligase YbdK (ATP-grasp superfamily)